ncbi:MAG: class I SAM-dependent methyltransferase [Actinobacteria bacterium]|nr:class I SAM-dependent methyltransferase [Actinomycetota bacterium]
MHDDGYFSEPVAERYDERYAYLTDPAVVDPIVAFLADLGRDGDALELGIGTGRIALPLARRGIRVHGIELSKAMVARLRAKPGAEQIGLTIGDFAASTVEATSSVAYLVANTIMNLTTQDEQVACFRNAAAHLEPGGCFVIEVLVPDRRLAAAPGDGSCRPLLPAPDRPAHADRRDGRGNGRARAGGQGPPPRPQRSVGRDARARARRAPDRRAADRILALDARRRGADSPRLPRAGCGLRRLRAARTGLARRPLRDTRGARRRRPPPPPAALPGRGARAESAAGDYGSGARFGEGLDAGTACTGLGARPRRQRRRYSGNQAPHVPRAEPGVGRLRAVPG